MGSKAAKPQKRKKVYKSIAIDEDNLDWVKSQIRESKYANLTHAINFIIRQKRKENIGE